MDLEKLNSKELSKLLDKAHQELERKLKKEGQALLKNKDVKKLYDEYKKHDESLYKVAVPLSMKFEAVMTFVSKYDSDYSLMFFVDGYYVCPEDLVENHPKVCKALADREKKILDFEKRLKAIAEKNGVDPSDLWNLIQDEDNRY